MIIFKNLSKETPFIHFKEKYDLSIDADQNDIDAICIASLSMKSNEVNSPFFKLTGSFISVIFPLISKLIILFIID